MLHGKDPASFPGRDGSYPLLCHLLDTVVVAQILWSARVRDGLRKRVAEALGRTVTEAGQLLALAAAAHDLGKLNPYFQYQERLGTAAGYADALCAATGLPRSSPEVRAQLTMAGSHPLRRHEFISHRILTGDWPDSTQPVAGEKWLATLVAGHHGYWRDPNVNGTWVGRPGQTGDRLIEGWEHPQQAMVERVSAALGVDHTELSTVAGVASAAAFATISGLLTLADWMASVDAQVEAGKSLWDRVAGTDDDPYASSEAARRWMESRTDELRQHVTASLGQFAPVERNKFDAVVLGNYQPRPLQAEALGFTLENEPGLWIAMYPTGDGKTEAALLRGAVRPDEGLFFGLPTLATTDAMEARLSSVAQSLGDPSAFPLMKSHQFASLMTAADEPRLRDRSDDAQCDHANPSWYTASIRKLVAPNVVGTVDQALAGALAQRHITLRLFGLANHHVVLDEVHTYDPYQTELLVELLYWWGATRTRVTLLSATLPTNHMRSMVRAYRAGLLGQRYDAASPEVDALQAEFPSTVSVTATEDGDVLVETRRPDGDVRRPQNTAIEVTQVARRDDRVAEHIAWVEKVSAAHPSSPIAVVSNVVADCTAVAEALAADETLAQTHDVLCLHSGLVAGHRTSTEKALIQRAGKPAHATGFADHPGRRPIVVVGTQVIQASLDFDVDFMATDLAPAPDLIQRLGRVWRFEGALDGFRGGRLPVGTDRSLHVVSVIGDDGAPTRTGSAPYLTAVLARTHAALVAELARTPVVDVFAFSQSWVDASYDQDPFSLVSELESEQAAAMDEVVTIGAKQSSALISRAALARPNIGGGNPLLPRPGRGRAPLWSDLVAMTQRPDDESLMRTRYIERESMAVIVVDSGVGAHYLDPRTREHVAFPDASVERLADMNSEEAMRMIGAWRLVVPAALQTQVREGVEATLGGTEWVPRAKALESTPPLDLRRLDGVLTYHPRIGLTKESA